MDYIFKWWGAEDSEELGGELDVIWKTMPENSSVVCYRTWIKLAERDFILGIKKDESSKREANREVVGEAFEQWQQLFKKL